MLMPLRRPGVLASLSPAWCRLLAGVLIVGAAAFHVAFFLNDCALDLAPDEAHYWDWSRHLDWSYYSKGPLVAYLIRGSCELFGGWSEATTGNLMLAVRLPAVLCGSLLLLGLYVLTVQVFARERLALAVVALALTLPPIAVASSIMTIDAPYCCLWGWALVAGHRAIFRGSAWAWPVAGLLVGLGILAKYTMVLFLVSVGLFLLFTPAYRGRLWRPGFWVMAAVAALCCLPILVWNCLNGWVTYHHVNSLSGAAEPLHWHGPLVYLGQQAALLLVFWFLAWAMALWTYRPWVERHDGTRYLWWLSVPVFAVFLGFSPRTGGGEVNWPVTAYLSGIVLTAAWLARQLDSPARWYRRLTRCNLAITCAVGVALIVAVHNSVWLHPLCEAIAGPPSRDRPFPVRRFDPTCRLRGWRTLAAEVDAIRQELRAAGHDPVLAATTWFIPGELGVYCAGHPQAYSLGLALCDRHSQYDLWTNPIDNPQAFVGRPFILVGGLAADSSVRGCFERVEDRGKVTHSVNGRPVAEWVLTVCHGFRGGLRARDASAF